MICAQKNETSSIEASLEINAKSLKDVSELVNMHIVTYTESDDMKKILIVPNPSKDPSFLITQRVIAWFKQ